VFKDDALEFLKNAREDPEWVEDMLTHIISDLAKPGRDSSCYNIQLLQSRQVIFGDSHMFGTLGIPATSGLAIGLVAGLAKS
jgi:hypothetical protein